MLYASLVAAAILVLILLLHTYLRTSRSNLPLPPGPPEKSFLLGNVSDIPGPPAERKSWHTLSRKYGPVMHLRAVNRHIIILDTMQAAVDLLEKRGAIYSDRVRMPMLGELMGYDWNMSFMPYGDAWRLHRRALHQHLHEGALPRLNDHLERTNCRFLRALVDAPEGWWNLTHWLAGASIMSAVYGRDDTLLQNDPWVELSEEVVRNANNQALGGIHPVDIFPFLKYIPSLFPGAAFKRKALQARALQFRARDQPIDWVKSQMEAGTARPSITSALMDTEVDGMPWPADVIKNSTGIAYLAGADTTLAALRSFILAMVRNPNIQHKAQTELDRVIPGDRLPLLADRNAETLPYLEAVLRETYRKYPPVPLGIPHQSMQEDEYDGMRIPRGAVVIANGWAMLQDKQTYPGDTEVFRPERFMKEGVLDKDVMDPRDAAFGFGRRICPGRHFADAEVWLMMATLLHAFDILPAQEGVYPAEELEGRNVVGPVKFECRIVPRSPATRALVLSTFEG